MIAAREEELGGLDLIFVNDAGDRTTRAVEIRVAPIDKEGQ